MLSAFRRRLAARDSPLLRDAEATRELAERVPSIIQDVLGHPEPGAGRWTGNGIEPAESLRTADDLFDVALPIIARHRGLDDVGLLGASRQLHRSITDRIAVASLPYVEFLLARLHASHQDERRRVSRELHDRIGHGIAIVLQRLDMHRFFRKNDGARAERELLLGLTALQGVLWTVRQLSTELRKSVGEDGIAHAIESYLRDYTPDSVRVSVKMTGDVKLIPVPVGEELYLVVREACHNAIQHGHPSEMRITVAVGGPELVATVFDNGRGFGGGALDRVVGSGLCSMAERIETLNGTLKVESAIGEGTTVTVRVPLPGGGRSG